MYRSLSRPEHVITHNHFFTVITTVIERNHLTVNLSSKQYNNCGYIIRTFVNYPFYQNRGDICAFGT